MIGSRSICWLTLIGMASCLNGEAQESSAADVSVAGNEEVAEIVKNYEGRGTLADDTPPTPPEEALKGFRMREGFEIELIASEPDIGQPLHISWDSKGRMWVTQYLQYQFPAGLKIVEYDNHLRAQFDKVPEPPPHGTKGADKITVFEDTDGDGRYDSHRDVITGLNIATSCVTGAGGIWVSNAPYLLFYPDADGDANPDSDPVVKLSGFGIEDTHSVMNSLKWGPDGWLYGVNGSTTTGKVEDPATGKMVEWQGQMVWRYHPEWEKFEIWAEGGGNTFSLEIDSAARVFSGTNNGNTRGMYYPQGAYGKKSWGKHGPLTNPYAFGYIDHMKHEGDDRRFAQAFCIYEGGLFPESWNGKIIAANSLHNIVWVSELLPDGSTFRTVDEEPLVQTDDRWFRPVFCGVGPDGCVYLADWYDTRLSHVRPVDDWHKDSGRIYRIKPTGTKPKVPEMNLSEATAEELVAEFDDPNWVVRKRALLELGWSDLDSPFGIGLIEEREEKKLADSGAELDPKQLADPESLLALYMEHRRGEGPKTEAEQRARIRLLQYFSIVDPDREDGNSSGASEQEWEHIRELANDSVDASFAMTSEEDNVGIRAEYCSIAKRMQPVLGIQYASRLMREFERDYDDPHIPLLIWWAIEQHAESARAAIEALAAEQMTWESEIFRKFIAERLMRRYCMAGGEENFLTAARLLETAPDDDGKKRLMTGLQLAFQGTAIPELPKALEDQMNAYAEAGGGNNLSLRLQRGDKTALKEAIALLGNNDANPVERVEVAKALGDVGDPSVVPALLKVLGLDQQSALKRVALQSLANYGDPNIPKTILSRLGSTLPREHEVASTAHRVVAGRTEWAKLFLEDVDRAIVKARHVEPDVVQLLAQHGDPEIDAAIRKHWPSSVAATSEENQKEIARLKKIVLEREGDPEAGKIHFTTRCSACHQLFGEGQAIGPDLTPYERGNLDFWLPAIVAPSLELREGFLQYVATMKDDRVVIGMMRDQNPQTVTLRDLAGQESVLSRAEIKSLEASPISLMPPALLTGMSDEELRDLFAYLMK